MSYTIEYLQSEGAAQNFEVSALVNCMVQDAIKLSASDLHIEPWEKAIAVRARVNGVLVEVAHLPLELLDKISMRFKVMANLVTYQAGTPQDGAAVGGPELEGVQLRISIFPTTRGEKIVIRLFDPRDRRFDLNALELRRGGVERAGAPVETFQRFAPVHRPDRFGQDQHDVFGALPHHAARRDEREHQHGGRPGGIQSADDQPDADQSGAGIHLRHRLEKHHAAGPANHHGGRNSRPGNGGHRGAGRVDGASGPQHDPLRHVSAGAFTRLINMEIEPFMLASAILGVLGLRLVRCNCPDCSRSRMNRTPSQLRVLPEELRSEAQFRHGMGCPRCTNTGFSGRLPVTELLVVDEPFREAVLKKNVNVGPRRNCDSTGHENALAKRPAPRHQRPDVIGRNGARAGGGHDVSRASFVRSSAFRRAWWNN